MFPVGQSEMLPQSRWHKGPSASASPAVRLIGFSPLAPRHEHLKLALGYDAAMASRTAATRGIHFFSRLQQAFRLSLIANNVSVAACRAATYPSATTAPSNCMGVVATNAGVAAAPTVSDTSTSTLAPFSGTVIPVDVRVAPASAPSCHSFRPHGLTDE
jgi:hypothetical protein